MEMEKVILEEVVMAQQKRTCTAEQALTSLIEEAETIRNYYTRFLEATPERKSLLTS